MPAGSCAQPHVVDLEAAGSEFVTDDTDTCPYPHAFGDSTCPTGPSFVIRLESHFAARTIMVETLQATDGRDFDTVLLVSPSCSSVGIIASDDDGGSGLLSKLTFQVDAYQGRAEATHAGGHVLQYTFLAFPRIESFAASIWFCACQLSCLPLWFACRRLHRCQWLLQWWV